MMSSSNLMLGTKDFKLKADHISSCNITSIDNLKNKKKRIISSKSHVLFSILTSQNMVKRSAVIKRLNH